MGEIIKNYLLGRVPFWVCLILSCSLLSVGCFMPPIGKIDPSIIKAVGEIFGFAALAVFSDAMRQGYDAKFQHGNTTVEIDNNDKEQ